MTTETSRPGLVTVAVVTTVLAAVMLGAGSVLTALVSFDTLRYLAPASVPDDAVRSSLRVYRAEGALFAVAAVGLLVLTLRAARRDPRYRRSAVALGLALVVLVSLAAVVVGIHLLALLSVVPLTVGIVAFTRPAVRVWFAGGPADGSAGYDDV